MWKTQEFVETALIEVNFLCGKAVEYFVENFTKSNGLLKCGRFGKMCGKNCGKL